MPTEDEIKIILNVVNTEKIEQARAAIEREEAEIRRLNSALQAGSISQAAFEQAAARAAQGIQTAQSQIKSSGGGAFNGRALMEFSRLAEDAQYGLAGVLNNIPSLVQAMGGSNGLTGAISLAAVASYQLYRHWNDLATVFGGGHVKTQAEEMEELRKKTSLTADEAERLARAEAIPAKVKEFQGGQTEGQKSQDSAVTKAINEAGSDNVMAGIRHVAPDLIDGQGDAALAKAALDKAKAEEASIKANSEDEGAMAGARQRVLNAEIKLADARDKTAAQILATGALSKLFPGGLNQLRGLVDKDVTAFGPNGNQFRNQLKEAAKTPDEIEAQKADDFADAQQRESDNRRAQIEIAQQQADDEQDRQGEKQRIQENRDREARLANWQAAAQEQRDNEDMQAMNSDAMTAWQKQRNQSSQNSQIFSGAAAFHDAIQQSVKGPDRDPTAVEQLAVQREIAANTKRAIEQRDARNIARFN